MTAKSPMRALGNNYGAITDGRIATVALFHPSAAAHASPPAQDDSQKRCARTAPHAPGHVAHDQRMTRARDRQFRAICKP